MGNAFFLICDENPKVTERPANLHKASKETRDQACQLIAVPARFKTDFWTKNGVA